MKKVGIVVLNYNNVDDTINCVDSIYEHCNTEDFALCVVDNDSRIEVQQRVGCKLSKVKGFCQVNKNSGYPPQLPQLVYLVNNINQGYANGNNLGLNFFSQYDEIGYYLILNNDVLLTENIITTLRSFLDSHPSVAVVSPLLYGKEGNVDYECARYEKSIWDFLYRGTPLHRWSFVKERANHTYILKEHPEYIKHTEVDINLPSGSCMMFHSRFFSAIGFFDPNTFLYFEEDILWKKMQKAGFRSVLVPQVSCIHLGACSTSLSSQKVIGKYYVASLIYYLKNYADFSSLTVWLLVLVIKARILLSKVSI